MINRTRVATLFAGLALAASPAVALAVGPPAGTPIPSNPGTAHMPAAPGSQSAAHKPAMPGPKAGLPAKAKAYGKYCQSESKKHVAGQHGTPFSKCVTAMAKLASGSVVNPTTACKTESKKHVAGQHGTPFSKCVSAAAKLLADTTTTPDPTTTDPTDG